MIIEKLISRRQLIQRQADKLAKSRDRWIRKNSYFYNSDYSYMKFLVGKKARILEVG